MRTPMTAITWLCLTMITLGMMSEQSALAKPTDRTVTGAGATFPFPVYAHWAQEYNEKTGVKVNYQAIGSGGGIAQIEAKTVDFGATDDPLSDEDLQKAGLVQFPTVIGGVVVVVNLNGVGNNEMKLPPDVLADIFLGKITSWDDARLAGANQGLKLPATKITVAHRSDGSGTTFLFTSYLSQISSAWKDKVGAGKAVEWPVGVGGKGNPGVAAAVDQVQGAIGYVEYAYAAHAMKKLNMVQLHCRDGAFVTASSAAFEAAAKGADWSKSKNFTVSLLNQPGKDSWPITGATYILVYEKQSDAGKAKAVLQFFDWAYHHGGAAAKELDYVPLPKKVVEMVEDMWAKRIRAGNEAVWTTGK